MDQTQPVSLDTSVPQQDNPVSINVGQPSPISPDASIAAQRAYKADVGIGSVVGKNYNDLYADISTGNEPGLRAEAASKLQFQNQLNKQQLLVDTTQKFGRPLSPEEINHILDPTAPTNLPVDARSVIEQGFAHYHIGTLDTAAANMGNNTLLDEAKDTLPNTVDRTKQISTDLSSKNQYVLTKAQDAQKIAESQSWLGWTGDQAKTFLSFGMYDEFKLRGWLENTPAIPSLGIGSSLYEQSIALYDLPFNQFKDKVDTIYNKLSVDNPHMAVIFLNAMAGQSLSDQTLANVGTVVNAATLPGIGGLAKGLLRPISLYNETKQAYKDILVASRNPGADASTLLNAAGNPGEAAVQQTVSELTGDLKGTSSPTQRAMGALTSSLRVDQADIASNPGRFGQEIVNRIQETSNTVQNGFLDAVTDAAKVNRIPELTASPDAIRKIKDGMRNNYTGPANTLLDVAGPHYEPISNTYWYEHQIGREDGTLFASEQEARNKANLQGLVLETPKPYITGLEKEAERLRGELKIPPQMEADTHELNRHSNMKSRLESIQRELEDIDMRGADGYAIKQQGLGFYISKLTPWDETSDITRSLLPNTVDFQGRSIFQAPSWVNAFTSWLRTPEETLSRLENNERKIATHGPSILQGMMKKASEDIEKIPGKYSKDWARAIDASRQAIDPVTGRKGYFLKSPQELEDFYQRNFNRLPEMKEIQAYFTFKRNVEIDRALRTIRSYSLKSRVGTEQHRVFTLSKDGDRVYSPFFEGIAQKERPGGEDNVLFVGNKVGGEKMYAANDPRLKKMLDKAGDNSFKFVRVHNPEIRPLQTFGKVGQERVRYVITSNVESKPLAWENQVNRTGGGHFNYNYDYYLKQARMRFDTTTKKWWYEGDTTIMPFKNTAVAKDIGEHMDNVRKLLKAKDEAGAKAYHDEHLPTDWNEHRGWYKDGRDPNGNSLPARLSLDEPFHVVPTNKLIADVDNTLEKRYYYTDKDGNKVNAFKDGTRQGSDARQSMVEYTGERDAYEVHTINDEGSRGNPLYKYEPAEMMDPIPTMNRAMNRIINSSFLDDMKINSVEHWIKQATPYLKASAEDLQHSPFYHFANPEWRTAVDPSIKSFLMSNRLKMQQFTGMPSTVDTALHSVAQKLSDSVYRQAGPKASLIPTAMLPYVRNPLAFMRSVTFHTKMGLYALPQIFTQASTGINVLAIAGPKHLPAILSAVLMHQYGRMNGSKEIISHMDGLLGKLRLPGTSVWRPGEFTEARDLLIKHVGFQNIGGEHAFLDTPWSTKIIQNGWHSILDWGETPFREGAMSTRMAAWYAAYKEFREVKTFGAITRGDLSGILGRAADLDHNMSRASNSVLHTGIMSVPSQFLAYSMRISELLTGKRLTWQEKTRLIGVSALLYGVPMGALGLSGIPLGDWMRSQAQKQGYVVGDSAMSSLFMEGLPSLATAYITGSGDIQKGNFYNFSKFGSKGLDPLQEFMDSDKTIWDIMGGASYSTLANAWAQTSGLRNVAMNLIRGDQQQFSLTLDDMIAPFREIAAVNDVWRTYAAINTGRWLSKNETYLSDATPVNSIFMGVTGLTDQRVADVAITAKAIKNQEEMQKYILREFIKEVHRGMHAASDNDWEQSEKYFKNAKAFFEIGDYPIEKRGAAISTAFQGNESLIDRLNWDYFYKDLPPSQVPIRNQALRAIQDIKQKKASN